MAQTPEIVLCSPACTGRHCNGVHPRSEAACKPGDLYLGRSALVQLQRKMRNTEARLVIR